MATKTRKSNASPAVAKAPVNSTSDAFTEATNDGPSVAQNTNLEQRIAERAYELYLQRGATGDDALSDWFQAEAEIRNAYQTFNESQIQPSQPSPRPSGKGRKGKAPENKVQPFGEASAGGI
jgi:hypothetical protein